MLKNVHSFFFNRLEGEITNQTLSKCSTASSVDTDRNTCRGHTLSLMLLLGSARSACALGPSGSSRAPTQSGPIICHVIKFVPKSTYRCRKGSELLEKRLRALLDAYSHRASDCVFVRACEEAPMWIQWCKTIRQTAHKWLGDGRKIGWPKEIEYFSRARKRTERSQRSLGGGGGAVRDPWR